MKKNLIRTLSSLLFIGAYAAHAAEFRFGPATGLGIGTPLGTGTSSSKVGVGIPIGGLVQFDFDSFGVDLGLNYRYNDFAFSENNVTADFDFSSLELPATVYYEMHNSHGFFKFGGGAEFEYSFGNITEHASGLSQSGSFSDYGFRKSDLYVVGQVGYEFLFNAWSLSLDFLPKYGLIDRVADSSVAGINHWHTLMFDFKVGFLF